ncbi:Stress response protein ish1 [Schizosaccharomyces pombe]
MRSRSVASLGVLLAIVFYIFTYGFSTYRKNDTSAVKTWLEEHSIPYGSRSSPSDFQQFISESYDSLVPNLDKWSGHNLNSWLGKKTESSYLDAISNKIRKTGRKLSGSVEDARDATQEAWESQKASLFESWSDSQLRAFLARHSPQFAAKEKKGILEKLSPASLRETAAKEYDALTSKLGNTGDWIYDTWSDNELRTWLHDVGVPISSHESTRTHLLRKLKNYISTKADEAQPSVEAVKGKASEKAKQAGEFVSDKAGDAKELVNEKSSEAGQYAGQKMEEGGELLQEISKRRGRFGNWWANSGLKAYFDAHGIPAYQPSPIDQFYAHLRRQYYLKTNGYQALKSKAYEEASNVADSASSIASNVASGATEAYQGAASGASRFTEGAKTAAESVTSAFEHNKDTATSKAKQMKGKAASLGSTASEKVGEAADYAAETASKVASKAASKVRETIDETIIERWQDSKLKEFLFLRGVPVPQRSTKDQLLDLVRKHFNKGAVPNWAAYFDTLSSKELSAWIKEYKKHYHGKLHPSKDREHLFQNACNIYRAIAEKADKSVLQSIQSKFPKATVPGYDSWSNEDLKSALKEYGDSIGKVFNRKDAIERLKRHDILFYGPVVADKAKSGVSGFLRRVASFMGFGTRDVAEIKLGENIQKVKDTASKASSAVSSAGDYVETNVKKAQRVL